MWSLLKNTFEGKRVFLTGHTGFKGAWLLQVLNALGADVKGYSLASEKSNDLFQQLQGDTLCYSSVIADINDLKTLQGEIVRFEPHFIFHLAAQSLVRRSYAMPIESFMTNAMGTAHVLEALRVLPNPCVAVMITTDKVYENPERGLPFQEEDALGGHDPYSASKAAAEIVISSYRRSFFHPDAYEKHQKSVASVRAGNVIGGGDYSDDRIIPDIVRAIERLEPVKLRNPQSVRPWQHVLEPLTAYLLLAAKMQQEPRRFATAYNLGPSKEDELSVEALTKIFIDAYGNKVSSEIEPSATPLHEANLLLLDSTKAHQELQWQPKLNATEAIRWTSAWYADRSQSAADKCTSQIKAYFER